MGGTLSKLTLRLVVFTLFCGATESETQPAKAGFRHFGYLPDFNFIAWVATQAACQQL